MSEPGKKRKLNDDEVEKLQSDYDQIKEELEFMKRKYNS